MGLDHTRMQRIKTKLAKSGLLPVRQEADYVIYRIPVNSIKIIPPKKISERQKKALLDTSKKHGFGSKSHG
jgi:hypothetical protein